MQKLMMIFSERQEADQKRLLELAEVFIEDF
jgi:hypothetical protein